MAPVKKKLEAADLKYDWDAEGLDDEQAYSFTFRKKAKTDSSSQRQTVRRRDVDSSTSNVSVKVEKTEPRSDPASASNASSSSSSSSSSSMTDAKPAAFAGFTFSQSYHSMFIFLVKHRMLKEEENATPLEVTQFYC